MSKHSLLLVDGDTRSLRVLEVSLRKSGFMVTAAMSVQDAVDKLELHAPDLIISETTFPDGDGFDLRRRVRSNTDWAEIPFIFLTAEAAIENKIRGLELGVDDYLTKPIYIKEIVTRINILLQKRQRTRLEERRDGRTRFAGRVQDMPVVDVIQTIEISRKSGVIQFVGDRGRQAAIYFRDGKVIDAEAGTLLGEDAVYRLLTWSEGEFEVVFRTVRRRDVITTSSQGLLMEGMRRLDEWSRLLEQLPPLSHRFEVDTAELSTRLGEVPDDNNSILRLIDGKRTLLEVIDASDTGDLECLQAISRLYFEEMLVDLDHGRPAKRDTGKPMPLVEVEMSPMDEAISGPHSRAPSGPYEVALEGDAVGDGPSLGRTPSGEMEVAVEAAASEREQQEEVTADEDVIGEEPIGPLGGSYRPSSLRLIDEAVAAAEAIEPQLFAEESPTKTLAPVAVTPPSAAVLAAQQAGTSAVKITPPETPTAKDDAPPPEPEPERPARREDSGMRMIQSLGRDRAEASGELVPISAGRTEATRTTQRELITILPRRITREIALPPGGFPGATPPAPAPTEEAAKPAEVEVTPVLGKPAVEASSASNASSASAVVSASAPRIAIPRTMTPPRQGSGVRAKSSGPGLGALLLLVLAAALILIAILVHHSKQQPAVIDAGAAVPPSDAGAAMAASDARVAPRDAGVAMAASDAAMAAPRDASMATARDAVVAMAASDAGVAMAPIDAPPPRPPVDAAPKPTDAPLAMVTPDAASDAARPAADAPGRPKADEQLAQAKALMEEAHDALGAGDFEKAIAKADASLKLRKTARTYLVRAQALQKLDRLDEALQDTDTAVGLAPDFAPCWEMRGRILWAAHRYDEAREAFQKFLALDPTSSHAAQIQRMLAEPK
ncbi:MAG TPA: DUF4388 domain-containing protein [Kofleriaceae bacterium]